MVGAIFELPFQCLQQAKWPTKIMTYLMGASQWTYDCTEKQTSLYVAIRRWNVKWSSLPHGLNLTKATLEWIYTWNAIWKEHIKLKMRISGWPLGTLCVTRVLHIHNGTDNLLSIIFFYNYTTFVIVFIPLWSYHILHCHCLIRIAITNLNSTFW